MSTLHPPGSEPDAENCTVSLRRQLKRAQDELRTAKRELAALEQQQSKTSDLLDTIYRCSGMSVFVVDVTDTGNYVYAGVNPIHARLLGLGSGEIIGRRPEDLVPHLGQDNGTAIRKIYDAVMESKCSAEFEFQAEIDGRREWWLSKLTPLLSESGAVHRIVGNSIIITRRKKMEQALIESVDRYNAQFNNSLDMMFIYTLDGRFIDANPAALETFGYTRDEIRQLKIEDVMTPESLTRAADSLEVIIETGKSADVNRYTLVDKHGTSIYVESSAVLLSKDNAPFAILGVVRNITERLKLEEQLRQSDKMRAVGQLAGGLAHDFNNQLGVILGSVELLLEHLTSSRARLYADNILTAAGRASELTSKMLSFSRKERSRSVAVNLHNTIREVILLLDHTLDKSIQISAELESAAPITRGDPNQLQNAVLNLAINARDAMPDGGALAIATQDTTIADQHSDDAQSIPPGHYVQISVSDTGCGMAPSTLDHIFEPFFTTKSAEHGTGMGLATVYGTVKSHGGAITVESDPGKGTTFHLFIPRAKLNVSSEAPTPDSIDLDALRGEGHIFIVDDDTIVRRITTEILCKLGYTVTSCQNGYDAVAEFQHRADEIDLVIMDIVMPVMNGKQCYVRMKEIDPDVVVLISSGQSIDGIGREILDLGANGFLHKPFQTVELASRIKSLIKPSR